MSQKRLLKLWSERISPVVATGVFSAVAMGGLSGCDTVALLSFSDRVFNDVRLVGLTPEGGSCKGSNGDAVVRFVLADGDGNPINNTTVIGNSAVSLGQDDIDVETVTMYQLPDLSCSDSAADCQNGFACEATDAGPNVCQLAGESVSVSGGATMVASIEKTQAFAVLVENTASMAGTLPEPIAALSPDVRNADGVAEPDGRSDVVGANYKLKNDERAADSNNTRFTAVTNMAQTWRLVYERAADDNQVRSAFGVWTFNRGEDNVRSPQDIGWVFSADRAREVGRSFDNVASNNNVAAVYQAMLHMIEADDKFGQFDQADEKILTLIVDGPDDIRSGTQDVQAVIDAASAANVRIFIVHIDPEVQTNTNSGDRIITDVTTYVQQQDAPCDPSGNSCKNFEICRQVTAYANNENSNVTTPAGKIDDPYCAINYEPVTDTTGRIGPIQEYAELACATGGGYLYYSSLDKLSDGDSTITKLPLALDSLWEVPVDLSAFSSGAVQSGEPYKVGMTFSTNVNGTQKRQNMTADFIAPRPVLFSAE